MYLIQIDNRGLYNKQLIYESEITLASEQMSCRDALFNIKYMVLPPMTRYYFYCTML